MPDAATPSFVPIWLACRCGHAWNDWQPANVPAKTWVAHIRTYRCPKCASHRNVLIRTTPLDTNHA
jgi:hypothetical protein